MIKPYLEAGKAVGTHGIKGELRVEPWCDTPAILCGFKTLFLGADGAKPVSVVSARVHGSLVLMKLDGVDSIEAAETFRGKIFFGARADFHKDEGAYFIQELLDSKVFHADSGALLGVLTDVSPTGANDVWHITKDGKEYLIPAIAQVVAAVDIERSEIMIRPMEGIFDAD